MGRECLDTAQKAQKGNNYCIHCIHYITFTFNVTGPDVKIFWSRRQVQAQLQPKGTRELRKDRMSQHSRDDAPSKVSQVPRKTSCTASGCAVCTRATRRRIKPATWSVRCLRQADRYWGDKRPISSCGSAEGAVRSYIYLGISRDDNRLCMGAGGENSKIAKRQLQACCRAACDMLLMPSTSAHKPPVPWLGHRHEQS